MYVYILAGFDPVKYSEINESCTFLEIARAFVMRSAANAIEVKK